MLEQSKQALAAAPSRQRLAAEIIALRYLASELEENLIPAEKAELTARDHKNAGDEVWLRTVYGILLGLRSAETQGYSLHF